MASRAYGGEDKAARRRAILQAAAGLFVAGSGELPPVAEVARAAGLAKGTVYLYFRTKEAIFSALLLEGWGEVIDLVEQAFASGRAADDPVPAFLAAFVAHVEAHPDLLRLDALAHAVLMRNLEPATLAEFKQALHVRLEAGGAVVEAALGLPAGRGLKLLTRTYALTSGLWQSFDETAALADGSPLKSGPGFPAELEEALDEYWRGALPQAGR